MRRTDSRTNDQELVDRLEEVGVDRLDVRQPHRCTVEDAHDLPGWSVQDNVVHISGIESSILGGPHPTTRRPTTTT